MPTLAPTRLTDAQLDSYKTDGYVVVPGLYEPERMLQWKVILNQVLDEQKAFNPAGVVVWNTQNIHPVMLEAMRDSYVSPILQQLLGPDVEFLSAKAVYKNAATQFGSPFHQDWFYWEGAHKISVWIALDDATAANGCLIFLPGTHTRVFPKQVDEKSAIGFNNTVADKDLQGIPQVTLNVKRGDAVFFHDLAIHGSHPNTAGGDRWSMISTYRNAAVPDDSMLGRNLWIKPMLVSGRSVNGGMPV